jgi:hypothetical protein
VDKWHSSVSPASSGQAEIKRRMLIFCPKKVKTHHTTERSCFPHIRPRSTLKWNVAIEEWVLLFSS